MMIRTAYPASRAARSKLLISSASVAIAAVALAPQSAQAQVAPGFQGTPGGTGPNIATVGSATRTIGPVGGTETITVSTAKTQINWTPFDQTTGTTAPIDFLPAANTATFTSTTGLTDYTVLNRIIPVDPNRAIALNGKIFSTLEGGGTRGGKIWFYSPGGILVGSGALIDVGSLLLTTADPTSWTPNATGFNATFGTAAGASKIQIAAGAQLKALQQGSYIALIAPRIEQGGTVTVNGSAAYVAAEQVTMTMNQGLFDIQVPLGGGTDDPEGVQTYGSANGIVHTGTTTGPANTTAADNHSIYMVAVPKNQALTMLLDGNIGFTPPATTASVQNGQIILSAGWSINDTSGSVSGSSIPGTDAGILIGASAPTSFTSNVYGLASGDITALATTGDLSFAGDLSLHNFSAPNAGDILLEADSGNTLSVLGNVTLDSQNAAQPSEVSIEASGGDVTIGGNVMIGAGGTTGSPAGSAWLTAFNGTLSIGGSTQIYTNTSAVTADSETASADAQGGDIHVEAYSGGNIATGSLQLDASANGQDNAGGGDTTAGDATGGNIYISADTNGSVTVDGNLFGNASGYGGNMFDGSTAGGKGTGGGIQINQFGGDIHITGDTLLTSYGIGGSFAGTGIPTQALGGDGQGGIIRIWGGGSGTTTLVGNVTLASDATGGSGQTGGYARGGEAGSSSQNGTINLGPVNNFSALARGGNASVGFGGTGGSARGGVAYIEARAYPGDIESPATTSTITGDEATIDVSATGGTGGAGNGDNIIAGDGGEGQGGFFEGFGTGGAYAASDEEGGSLTLGSVTLLSNGLGGAGGVGGSSQIGGRGGNGLGGNTQAGNYDLNNTGGSSASSTYDSLTLVANGFGGTGGSGAAGQGDGGDAMGGAAFLGANGLVHVFGDTSLSAAAWGGTGANGGRGDGLWAILQGAGVGVMNLDGNVTLDATGFGGNGTAGLGGVGQGGLPDEAGNGSGIFALGTSSIVIGGSLGFYDNGFGGSGVTGGVGTGGSAAIHVFGSISAGSIDFNTGGIGGSGSDVGGDASGGDATVLVSGSLSADSMNVWAGATGGAGTNLGGKATGGDAALSIDGGDVTTTGTVTVSAGGVGGVGLTGGDGFGGNAEVVFEDNGNGNAGGSLDIGGNLGLGSGSTGGDGAANASGTGGAGGDGHGGSARFFVTDSLQTGATIDINVGGNLSVDSTGRGGAGGNGLTGGAGGAGFAGNGTFLQINSGDVAAGEINVGSSAVGGLGGNGTAGAGGRGGDATGGYAEIDLDTGVTATNVSSAASAQGGNGGAGSTIAGDGGDAHGGTGRFYIFGNGQLDGSANVWAGGVGGNGANGGLGHGGFGQIWVEGVLNAPQVNIDGRGTGGNGSAGNGGDSIGNDAELIVNGGSADVTGDVWVSAVGNGDIDGNPGNDGSFGSVNGGNAQGGLAAIVITPTGGSLTVGGETQIFARANGGGAGTGTGGDGHGGEADLIIGGNAPNCGECFFTPQSAPMVLLHDLSLLAFGGGGTGGNATTGGAGGEGLGGSTGFALDIGSFTGGDITANANGVGGDGGNGSAGRGGDGGNGIGGSSDLTIGGTFDANSYFGITHGFGGAGGGGTSSGDGGDGFGGPAYIDVMQGATAHLVDGLVISSSTFGGDGANGGDATDGTATIDVEGALTVDGLLEAAAQAFAGNGSGGSGGNSSAGTATINITGSATAGNVYVAAQAGGDTTLPYGVGTTAGGDAVGGSASFNVDGGSATVTGEADILASALGGTASSGPAGTATGGSVSVSSLNGGDFTAGTLYESSVGDVGTGSIGLVANGGTMGFGDLTLETSNNLVVPTLGTDIAVSGLLHLISSLNITFGDLNVGSLKWDADGDVDGGNIVVADFVNGEAQGAVSVGNISAGGVNEDGFSVAMSSATSLDVGNVSGAQSVGFATTGNLNAGNISSGDMFMALVGGNIDLGSITTPSTGRVYLADVSMFLDNGGGQDNFDPNAVLALAPVATSGSIKINGPVSTGTFQAAAGTSFTSGAILAASDILATAGTTLNVGNLNAGGAIDLDSTGALTTGALVAGTSLTATSGANLNVASANAGTDLALSSLGVLSAGNLHAGQAMDLHSTGAMTTGSLIAGTSIDAVSGGNLTLTTADAGTDLALSSGGVLSTGNLKAGQAIGLNSTGAMTAGSLTAGSSIDATSGGNMTVANGNAGTDITLTSAHALHAGNLTAGGTIALSAVNDLVTNKLSADGDVTLDASGNLTTLDIVSAGAVTAGADGNVQVGNVTAGTGKDIALDSGGTLTAANLSAGGSIDATSVGNLGVGNANAGADLSLTSGAALSAGHLTAGGALSLSAVTDLGTGDLSSGGDLSLDAGGNLTSLDITSGGAVTAAADGDVHVGNVASGNGNDVTLGAGGNLTTGAVNSAGKIALTAAGDVTASDLAAASTLAVNAGGDSSVGDVTATDASFTATGTANFLGVVSVPTITVTSADINVASGASLGVFGVTDLLTLNAVSDDPIVIGSGGSPAAGQYVLDEDGDIEGASIVVNAVAATSGGAAPDVHIFDVDIDGSQTSGGGASSVEVNTTGSILVGGAINYANAGADDSLSLNSGDKIEVATDAGGSIAMTDSSGNLSGSLTLTGHDVWVANQATLAKLEANPDYAARNTDLGTNTGTNNQAGFLQAGGITVDLLGSSLMVQNSGTAQQPAGISIGSGGLTIINEGTEPATVILYGRRVSGGTTTSGSSFVPLVVTTGSFSDSSTINGCDFGGCAPASTPTGAESILGPIGLMGNTAAVVEQDAAENFLDQVFDFGPNGSGGGDEGDDGESDDATQPPDFWQGPINTGPVSFDPPIDDPVTSGSDGAGGPN